MSNTPGVQSWKDMIRGKMKTCAWDCEQRGKIARKEAGKPSLSLFLEQLQPRAGTCLAPCDAHILGLTAKFED